MPSDRAMLPTCVPGSVLACCGIGNAGALVVPCELVIESARLLVREWRSFLMVLHSRKQKSQALLMTPLGW